MLKNGLYFTVPQLVEVGERFSQCKEEYDEKQQFLVEKAIETATTYLPVVESVAEVISELDVLLAFATATALSPGIPDYSMR